MGYIREVKEIARNLDPKCWESYSGEQPNIKRLLANRHRASLEAAQSFYDANRYTGPEPSVLDRHPRPWRLEDATIVDANGLALVWSTEELGSQEGAFEFIIETVNNYEAGS